MNVKKTGSSTDDFFAECYGNNEESPIVLSDFRNKINTIIKSDTSKKIKLEEILKYVENGVDVENSDDFILLLKVVSRRLEYVTYKEEYKIALFQIFDEITKKSSESEDENEEMIGNIYFFLKNLVNSLVEDDDVELFSGKMHKLLSDISEKDLDVLISLSQNKKGVNKTCIFKSVIDEYLREKNNQIHDEGAEFASQQSSNNEEGIDGQPIAFEIGGYDKTNLDISVTNPGEALEALIKISSLLTEIDIFKEDIKYLEGINREIEDVFAESEQLDDIKMQAKGNLAIAKRRLQEAELKKERRLNAEALAKGLSEIDKNSDIYKKFIAQLRQWVEDGKVSTTNDKVKILTVDDVKGILDKLGEKIILPKDVDSAVITSKVKSLLNILNSKDGIEDNQLISAARKIKSVKLTNSEISSILFSFRNLDSYVLRRGVIDVMAKKIDEADGEMSSKELIDSISGLRNLDSTVVSRELMNSLAKKINGSDDCIDAEGFGIMMHSLKNLDSLAVTHKFTEALYIKLQGLNSKLEARQVTKCLTGIGNLSPTIMSSGFIKAILGDINERWADFNEADILTILNGLINYSDISGISEIINILFLALEGRWQKYEEVKNPRSGVQIYNLYGRLIPIDLENAYEDFVNNDKIVKSKAERRAVEIVRNVTSGMYIEENKYVSGFEMDIFLPRHRLNIEVDGPEHYSKKSMDLKRDRHLLEAKMITVQRVNLLQEDIKDRVTEILNISKICTKRVDRW